MHDLIKQLETLRELIAAAMTQLGLDHDRTQLGQLIDETLAPDFWSDPVAAGALSQRMAALKRHVDAWDKLHTDVTEALELAKLSSGGTDADLAREVAAAYGAAKAEYDRREFELKLSGPHDRNSAIIEIHAGTGGTDAQDWAQMLQRMYLRWAERQGLATEIISVSPGEEAGLKSATFEVNGAYAYGKLRSEKGVHRLVRLSPFNSDNLRQTSFALVEVLPQLEAQAELMIDPKDLRIDVYRSGGNGGQSVNTTDSAVRITHLPTGLVVAIQNERSQLQNREKAMTILRSRLGVLMEEQHKATMTDLRTSDKSAEWGSQIRSYVLHPYTKVKDHRTGAETSQASDVLDGELDIFTEAYLRSQIGS